MRKGFTMTDREKLLGSLMHAVSVYVAEGRVCMHSYIKNEIAAPLGMSFQDCLDYYHANKKDK